MAPIVHSLIGLLLKIVQLQVDAVALRGMPKFAGSMTETQAEPMLSVLLRPLHRFLVNSSNDFR